ncbi:MAG TPA: hypothetical protein VFH03_23815 [Actinoplanes sp.]|nr:hypothetical protein [Actinoplanes sp.]
MAVLTTLVIAVSACSSSDDAPPPAVSLAWRQAALTLPAGVSGAPVVRDAVVCGSDWFVVGAVRDREGATGPAAWQSSGDLSSWVPVRVDAQSYYGRQNVLFTVACRDGRLAAVGAKPGGAHGNPRVSSWLRGDDGVLHEVSAASFELYGGPKAVNVSRMTAGPAGFLITGNRASGAAVWSSADAAEFELSEGTPGLASDPAGITWAADGAGTERGWLVVGGVLPAGRTDRDALGWRSDGDGVWRRVAAAGATAEYEELQRVAVIGGTPVALGVRGPVFGVWRLESDQWRPASAFGSVRPSAWSGVRAVARAGSWVLAAVGDGSAYGLWASGDDGARWQPADLPAPVPGAAGTALSVTAGPGRVVLCWDDGVTGRIYAAPAPA